MAVVTNEFNGIGPVTTTIQRVWIDVDIADSEFAVVERR